MSERQVTRDVRAVEALLSDPNRHCIGHWGEDKDGGSVYTLSPRAVKWCLYGAVNKITNGDWLRKNAVFDALVQYCPETLRERGEAPYFAALNDSRGHEGVMEWLTAVREWLEAEDMGEDIIRAITTPIDLEVTDVCLA